MRGDLSEMPFTTVLRRLGDERATGTLTLGGLDGPGEVMLRDGRVLGARSPATSARLGDRLVGAGFLDQPALERVIEDQRRGAQRGRLGALLVDAGLVPRDAVRLFVQEQALDALLDLVRWRWGGFAFQTGLEEPPASVPVAMDVDDVLLVVGRRRRDWEALARVIPDLAAVPTFTDAARTVSATLEPDEFAVLASVDGDRDLHTLAADLGYHEFELTRIVYGLVQLGVVDIRLPEDEVGAALDAAFAPVAGDGPHATDREQLATEGRVLPFRRPGSPPELGAEPDAADPEPVNAEPEPGGAEPEPGGAEPEPGGAEDPTGTPAAGPGSDEVVDPPVETGDPSPPAAAASPPSAEPDEDADVSEFLRELSRLAGDDGPPSSTRAPRHPAPPSRSDSDDQRPRRRGLFGRS